METKILPVDVRNAGTIEAKEVSDDILDELSFSVNHKSVDGQHLVLAASKLKSSDTPVAFPTETVYGLGADATRGSAVKGIYKAKQRPSDNPLIVHFHSLQQLRSLLKGHSSTSANSLSTTDMDPIPAIYKPLIAKFWPGPLTIILPNPENSPLAPEVTAGLQTFGARMPRHPLALALLSLADVPVAAPSANASTKPSPTAAEHVAYDLDGRIETIVDGGPCDVGVESTVVDGFSQQPPLILRPGGISLEQIRTCPGWEDTRIGYKNTSEKESQPRAPGMKYRHYSPKATVVLFEDGQNAPTNNDLLAQLGPNAKIGVVRTKRWELASASSPSDLLVCKQNVVHEQNGHAPQDNGLGFAGMLQSLHRSNWSKPTLERHNIMLDDRPIEVLDLALGFETDNIARGIFSALRDLDRQNVDAIFVEGIDDDEGSTAAAVMNRLRKAAEIRVEG
ncbi:Putative threonylcarbamoyl-AMP synthase domain, YrdC-like domain-containing protein [Septoria linicola]|uniref:Threonylcarbamoyl-AMP synthase n=1 Tax=Septoria linicola TaxID=215465 RepID=A0A9Q9AVA8_9PEZI|nr:putative threonylcarbamoyl-AMP synthase domain, YrdC-like domain-containing protein [Septoria linicola]USW56542.1 Putative threonylcarbamoyl-AMP synthase domain, YrdC-like domain-containing protein [Septoria linicola]